MIQLYYYPLSPFSKKVRVALEEKELPYEKVFVNLGRDEQFGPEFCRINPHAKVPALSDGSVVVYESAAIIEYLEEAYPETPLLPKDPAARARARSLHLVSDSRFSRVLGPLFRASIAEEPNAEESALIGRAHESLTWHLEWLEQELAGRSWLAGGYSVADLAFGCAFESLLGFHAVPERYSRVWSWLAQLRQRPAWRFAKTVPMVTKRRQLLRPALCDGCGLPPTQRPGRVRAA